MYSHEDKMRANELYLRYHRSTAAVINEPVILTAKPSGCGTWSSRKTGGLSRGRHQRYDDLRKKAVDDRFFDRGQCFARAVRHLGYPNPRNRSEG